MNKKATREAYGECLAQLVAENENIVVLDADLSGSTKTAMAKQVRPGQHFNMGIAEGNMMTVAAGMAASGKTVFASTFAVFATGRAFEQIRNSIAYPRLSVKVCGTHSGISVGEDGATHQAIEDMAIMRAVPGMKVFQPCDDVSTKAIIRSVAEMDGPCYVRLGRLPVESVYDESFLFEEGKGVVLKTGKKAAVIASGQMVQISLQAAEMLSKEGIEITVIDMHTIKPIDQELLVEAARRHDVMITAEEHNVIGGLGSAVAEALAEYNLCKIKMIGIGDTFGESGTPDALMKKYGLTAEHIVAAVKSSIQV